MTPWDLAKESEHSHQRAFFAWANSVADYGFDIANNPAAYTKATREALFEYASLNYTPRPELKFMFAIPNGGVRDGITAGKLKAEGVKPGVPDVFLPVVAGWFKYHAPDQVYYGLFLEFKKPSLKPKSDTALGGVKSAQSDYHAFLERQGYLVCVVYSWLEAREMVMRYLDPAA